MHLRTFALCLLGASLVARAEETFDVEQWKAQNDIVWELKRIARLSKDQSDKEFIAALEETVLPLELTFKAKVGPTRQVTFIKKKDTLRVEAREPLSLMTADDKIYFWNKRDSEWLVAFSRMQEGDRRMPMAEAREISVQYWCSTRLLDTQLLVSAQNAQFDMPHPKEALAIVDKWAEVEIDSKPQGAKITVAKSPGWGPTPDKGRVPEGEIDITLDKDGYELFKRLEIVKSRQKNPLNYTLRKK